MSRLTDLIRQAKEKDPTLGRDLEAEFAALSSRRQFGLNFERHQPEAVELPGRLPRKGDKVRILAPRGSTAAGDQRLWKVAGIASLDGADTARLQITDEGGVVLESTDRPVQDVVVVAEFRDPIYPGLVSTGRVERGGDKPHHTVINAENFHALQTLQFTHRGKIDAIYIDPPYNTGARDWKYNNDYVEGEDIYRHSKWLAFMERRLKLASDLLNPLDSVLIVTIDEKEYLRLGLLLEQTFPDARIQMVSSVINRKGVARVDGFARVDEYLYIVMLGECSPAPGPFDMLGLGVGIQKERLPDIWNPLMRRGSNADRSHSEGCFYPIFIDPESQRIVDVGPALGAGVARSSVEAPAGLTAVWPIRRDGREGVWQMTPANLRPRIEAGFVKVGTQNKKTGQWTINYLISKDIRRVETGEIVSKGKDENGVHQLEYADMAARPRVPKTVWNVGSHDATEHGSTLLTRFLKNRRFPFPKSLYAVEDVLRFFVKDKQDATILDFFAGSGTTAHAVMRLNHQDGGRRQSISITNNEVSADEQKRLRKQGLRPGDREWEALGICNYITKPRIEGAISGSTADGTPISGDYKFIDEFPISDGFEESVEFFTLTYESPWRVARGRAFDVVAPLLWMRAGSEGRRIDKIPVSGWDVADVYGVIADLDQTGPFLEVVTRAERVRVVFIVTDDDRAFQSVCSALPERVEPVRLYESYLQNFEIKGRD